MISSKPIVYILDDDLSVRKALERLMHSAGLESQTFESVKSFLESADLNRQACVIADIWMRGESSLELPKLLKRSRCWAPVVYVTAHDTEETRRYACEAGGAGYFLKPVDDQALLDTIRWVIGKEDQIAKQPCPQFDKNSKTSKSQKGD